MTDAKPYRHRFSMTITQHAVWLYHRFPLSFLARAAPMRTLGRYRDVQELLYRRGIVVSHETLRECLGQNGRRTRRLPAGASSSDPSSLKTCGTGNPDEVWILSANSGGGPEHGV
ncbi:transposase-like protein [Deinococcus sp. UYEF24]